MDVELPKREPREKRYMERGFRKYLSDYTVQEMLGPNGRVRSVALYVGPRFRYASGPERFRSDRLRMTLAVAVCLIAAMIPTLITPAIVRYWYVMAPLALSGIAGSPLNSRPKPPRK